MPTLRLTQSSISADHYRVEVEVDRQTAVSEFSFALTEQEQEDLRWYLEDFLSYPLDPAPKIAARIEGDMARIGADLFNGVFSSSAARTLWNWFSPKLGDARIEI